MTFFLPSPLIVKGIPLGREGTQLGFYGTPRQVLQQRGYEVGEPLYVSSRVLPLTVQCRRDDECLHQNTGLQRPPLSLNQDEEGQESEGNSTFCRSEYPDEDIPG